LARGSFYTRDGVLVASTAQEGLIRIIDGEVH
jgi:acyl-CoA thioesterase-2